MKMHLADALKKLAPADFQRQIEPAKRAMAENYLKPTPRRYATRRCFCPAALALTEMVGAQVEVGPTCWLADDPSEGYDMPDWLVDAITDFDRSFKLADIALLAESL